MPEQYVLGGELFDKCCSQIRLDLVSVENGFIRPGTCGDRGLDIAFVYSEELGKGQSPDIRLGLEPSLPVFRLLFRFEASLGCSFRFPIRIFKSARRHPATPGLIFVSTHIFPSFELVLR